MARKSNLIGTTETGNLSALGNAQQRDYNFVKSLLQRDDLIKYFAEPSVQESQERIDWYSETRGKITGFPNFNASQVERARIELNELSRELFALASKTENQVDKHAIENLSVLPDTDSIKMVGDQITIVNWAYRLHKRAKGDRQSTNFAGFAGFAEPETELDDQSNTNSNVGAVETEQPKADAADQILNQKNTSEEIVSTHNRDTSPNFKQEIDQEPEDHRANNRTPMTNTATWVLLSAFFLLLILILILLNDACGVVGLPFLYFC
jgi:uncharacterized integral membrane protein